MRSDNHTCWHPKFKGRGEFQRLKFFKGVEGLIGVENRKNEGGVDINKVLKRSLGGGWGVGVD